MNFIQRLWRKYTDWCDSMGLTPESQRCCAPKLSDPQREPEVQTKGNNES